MTTPDQPTDPTNQPHENELLNLTVSAMYDNQQKAVGIEVEASDAFDSPQYTQQLLEILATINSQTNQIASEVINAYAEDDTQKRALLEHYGSLKEYILENMIQETPTATENESESE